MPKEKMLYRKEKKVRRDCVSESNEPLNQEELHQRMQELEEREKALEEKESKLQKAEDRITRAKYNLYERIDVSLNTMNIVVAVIAIALVVAIVVGIMYR